MWIESHTTLSRNRKFKRFVRDLQISIPEALGILHLFWHHVLELAEDGNITKWESADIADYCFYSGDPEKLYKALLDNGFIDIKNNRKLIHDWWDYAGRYLTTRYRTNSPDKINEIKAIYGKTKVGRKSSQESVNQDNLYNQDNQDNLTYDKVPKDYQDALRHHFVLRKGWDIKTLHKQHYQRIGNATKIIYAITDKDIELAKAGVDWLSGQGYEWMLETLIKKWPEFLTAHAKGKNLRELEETYNAQR